MNTHQEESKTYRTRKMGQKQREIYIQQYVVKEQHRIQMEQLKAIEEL